MPGLEIPARIAEVLPGTWRLCATDYARWLQGERREATFEWELVSADPVVLDGRGTHIGEDGKRVDARATLAWREDRFVWRGRGVLALVRGTVEVTGVSAGGDVAVLRFDRTLLGPEVLLVLARADAEVGRARSEVALADGCLGLEPEEFARLAWFD
ncbi:hypothetical protein [Desertivibrio insolitus]|uniref:hypothetical protein n=1 Tax=Herbiconiux sp. SYSU D00978 TaxID=2812562 RepID=UPI001A972DD1|nr:hypothetical protein [Herbiconiux sp. SYSU D00978]